MIVQWAPAADRGERVDARADAEVSFARTLGDSDFQLVTVEPGQDADDAVSALRDDPAVLVADRDGYSTLDSIPNDPLFGDLWGLRNPGGTIGVNGFVGPVAGADINAAAGWDRTVGTPSTVVAVIDSGYRFDHPDLASVATTGYDFVGSNADLASLPSDPDPTDDNVTSGGHGVHVAGTVGAAGGNGVGISGVAQNARIMPLRACSHSSTTGDTICPYSSQIAAINYAGSHGARVANMSLGGTTFRQDIVNAIAANPNVLFVISAGNDTVNNETAPRYPCSYRPQVDASPASSVDNIVCVAATDQADGLASFSNWGFVKVDLGAPGTQTLSTYPKYTWDTLFTENFEVDDFTAKWTATGASGGFARSDEAPLSSFEMSTPPGPPVPSAGQVYESTSASIPLPTGYVSCKLSQRRSTSLATGTGAQYRYSVWRNGTEVDFSASTAASTNGNFHRLLNPASLSVGGTLQVRFRYTAGSAPNASNGVWLDDLKLECAKPSTLNLTYEYLQGTSMAAPHVAGAAGLLYSLKPSATVTEVRNALLAGVDAVPALAGKTVTGGRLDVAKALEALVPTTAPPPPPPGGKVSNVPATPVVAAGRCRVPKLAKLSLSRAKALLGVSNCKLGKVTKPKKKGQKKLPALIVKASTPKAGAELTAGAKVAVTLGPKPKPKKRKKR